MDETTSFKGMTDLARSVELEKAMSSEAARFLQK